MHLKKSSWIIICGSLGIDLLVLFLRHDLTFTSLSDSLFMFALFFLIIGGFLKVFASGFFDTFQRSFKKRTDTDFLKLSEVGRTSYRFWLEPAVLLLLLSLLFLLIASLI